MDIRGWVEKRNSNNFVKPLLGKQNPAARRCVTVAFLAIANPGQPTSPARQTRAEHEGGESPALGRAMSCRTRAPVSLCEELQSCIAPFAGLFWDLQRQDLGNLHSTPLDASTVSAKKGSSALDACCVCSYMHACFVFRSKLFRDKQETDDAELQVIKKKKIETNGMG